MTSTPYFPLGGGLDLVTPAIAKKPGYVIAAKNYEPAPAGYQRALGFERFDGRLAPSEAAYWMIEFDGGVGAITAGQTVTGLTSGATGVALANAIVTSGTYGGSNAVGYLGLGAVTGTFQDNEALQVGGVTKVTADGVATEGLSPDDETAQTWQAQASTNARALIAAPTGSGAVRGVAVYNSKTYCWRDNAGATACIMYESSASGWVAIAHSRTVDFSSGGNTEIVEGDVITGATSGATATVRRVVLQSGDWAAGTAAGYFVVSGQTGTFQAENLNVGASLNLATIGGNTALHSFPAGGRYETVNHNFYASADMRRLYGCNGVGPAFEFDGTYIVPIETGVPNEKPHRIAVHRNQLMLAHEGGNVTNSEPGEPLQHRVLAGAGSFGTGDEITGFISNTATVLTILGVIGVQNLYGNDVDDFTLDTLTDEAGALPWTANKVGMAIYMDNRGVRSMRSTQDFGNFQIGTLTAMIQPMLASFRKRQVQPVASCRVREKDQYRVFFDNNQCVVIHLAKRNPEVMILDYGLDVSCICSAEGDDLREEIYFGSSDGFVYQMERGNSFDGETMEYFIRLAFYHGGSPQHLKQWHKASLECEAGPGTQLRVSADYAYGDSNFIGVPEQDFTVQGGGGAWDVSNWDEFYFDAPLFATAHCDLDGRSQNMSLLICGETTSESPHTLQGMTVFFTLLGLVGP